MSVFVGAMVLAASASLVSVEAPSIVAPAAAQESCDANLFDCGTTGPEPSCDPALFDCAVAQAPTMPPIPQGQPHPIPSPPRFSLPSLPPGPSLDITLPSPKIIDPGSVTAAAADQAFAAERQRLRDQAGLLGALGPAGPMVYDHIDAATTTVAQEAVAKVGASLEGGAVASITGVGRPDVGYQTDAFPSSFAAGLIASQMADSFGIGRDPSHREAGSESLPTVTQAFHSTDGSIETTTNTALDRTLSSGGGDDLAETITLSYSTSRTDSATGASTAGPSGADTVRLELQGCPDSNGMVTEFIRATTTEGSGDPSFAGASYRASTEVAAQVFVGEDAWRVREETARQTDVAVQGPIQQLHQAADADNDWEVHFGSTWTTVSPTGSGPATMVADPASVRSGFSQDLRAVSDRTSLLATVGGASILGTIMAALPASMAIDAAERYWRSGACVEVLVLDGQSGEVEPGQDVHIVAQPRHRFEDTALAKPVVASLSGTAALQPTGAAVPAPAGFDYTAGEEGETGTVTLTSTSNRGIGSTSVTFTVPKKKTPEPTETPTPTPEPTPTPTPAPPSAVQGTIHYQFAMKSLSNPGETVDFSADLDLDLRSNDGGPIRESTGVVMVGTNSYQATYHSEHPCGGGPKEVVTGDGNGTLKFEGDATMTGNDKLILFLGTSPFTLKDHACPGSPGGTTKPDIWYLFTMCAPGQIDTTGVTQGLIGIGEVRDGVDGYSYDCTDVGGDDSVKLTVTVSGFLAGTDAAPSP